MVNRPRMGPVHVFNMAPGSRLFPEKSL